MTITSPARPGARTDDAELFGPYRLEERIGRGRTGEVFRAYDTVRRRTVALKRLHADLAAGPDGAAYAERFRRESRTAARLCSPHVIPIHDSGEIDGRLFVAMRLVSGGDLGEEIERHGPLAPARVASIVRQLADALDAAHADGLMHRDVTPSTVLLTRLHGRDVVHLVDFGVAPGPGLDRGADVDALGRLLVTVLTGEPPGRGDAAPPVTDRVPGLRPAVDAVVARALAPGDRYASAGDLAAAAHAALTGAAPTVVAPAGAPPVTPPRGARYVPVASGPPVPTPHPSAAPAAVVGTPRRSRTPWWITLGGVTALLAGLGVLLAVGTIAGDAPAPAAPPTPAPASGRLAAAFPDITRPGASCTPYRPGAAEYVTSTGARPVAVIRCDQRASVPGGYVYYTEWPAAADARRWHDDQRRGGPGLDGTTRWADGAGRPQGPRTPARPPTAPSTPRRRTPIVRTAST